MIVWGPVFFCLASLAWLAFVVSFVFDGLSSDHCRNVLAEPAKHRAGCAQINVRMCTFLIKGSLIQWQCFVLHYATRRPRNLSARSLHYQNNGRPGIGLSSNKHSDIVTYANAANGDSVFTGCIPQSMAIKANRREHISAAIPHHIGTANKNNEHQLPHSARI